VSDLVALRARVQDVDEQVLRLVAERMELVRQIGEMKKREGVALRDYAVERQVLERAERAAAGLGLPASLVHAVMQLLISESRVHQERAAYSMYTGDAERILIVGGLGKMGRWLVDFLRNQGHDVAVHDVAAGEPENGAPAAAIALEDGARWSSVALIATPLDRIGASIERLVELKYGGVICDVGSLKSHLRGSIEYARRTGARVTSIHPMFGPATQTLSDKVVCICDCGDAQATRRVEAFFADTAATLVRLSLEEHDRIAAYVLGLSHVINIINACVLAESGAAHEQLARVGSTTFASQMATTATVIRESPELYYSIQRLNPFTPEVYASLRRVVEDATGRVLSSDHDGFVRLMERGRQWMEESTSQAGP
jgi:chorismate mutase/prephenate dehydrogenase